MHKINLTSRQKKVFKHLEGIAGETFDLDDIINVLFGHFKRQPEHTRTKAISTLNCIENKFDCKCCWIDRSSPIGRGHKAAYRFALGCTRGSADA